MKLQDITTSLELSKQLKEAGYPQDSLFVFVENDLFGNQLCLKFDLPPSLPWKDYLSAPTASELGEALPGWIKTTKANFNNKKKKWTCVANSFQDFHHKIDEFFEADTEANARAKMWLYLKQEGLL